MATKKEKDILNVIKTNQAVMNEKLDNLTRQLRGHLARHWAVEIAVLMLIVGALVKVFVWR